MWVVSICEHRCRICWHYRNVRKYIGHKAKSTVRPTSHVWFIWAYGHYGGVPRLGRYTMNQSRELLTSSDSLFWPWAFHLLCRWQFHCGDKDQTTAAAHERPHWLIMGYVGALPSFPFVLMTSIALHSFGCQNDGTPYVTLNRHHPHMWTVPKI